MLMPFQVYDYRTDLVNMLLTPEIRGRFLRFEPGQVAGRHSHDLGHEIFLILEGECEMEIDGHRARLGPGQLCYAYAHQMHQASNPGDTPMIMYLSVTPHIEPTHTQYDPDTGARLPPRYNPPTAFDKTDTLAGTSTSELAERFLSAVRQLADQTAAARDAQAGAVAALAKADAAGDRAALKAAMDALWADVYATLRAVSAMSSAWNDLAPRAADPATR
jgi:quercetin dioxygenase-like cupin family protein